MELGECGREDGARWRTMEQLRRVQLSRVDGSWTGGIELRKGSDAYAVLKRTFSPNLDVKTAKVQVRYGAIPQVGAMEVPQVEAVF